LMQFFQFVIFYFCYVSFYIILPPILGLPSDLVKAGDHSHFFLPCCYLACDVHVQTKPVFVLWYNLQCFYY
jgi:hypothetical protein